MREFVTTKDKPVPFDQLFTGWREGKNPGDIKGVAWVAENMDGKTSSVPIGPHISFKDLRPEAENDYRYGSAVPSAEVCEWVKRVMLHCDRDSIHFQIYIRQDGTADLWAKYNAILGSHQYPTLIDPSTIPAEVTT